MSKLKLGFKVLTVTKQEGKIMNYWSAMKTVHYKLGEFTFPELGCGPLTCFKTRKGARHFLKSINNGKRVIRRCLYEPSSKEEIWELGTRARTVRDLEILNKNLIIPGQTVLAGKIMIF
jgi:hypothetical protein